MTLDELFKKKGQLIWEIEVAQANLQAVNQELIKMMNKKPEVPVVPSDPPVN